MSRRGAGQDLADAVVRRFGGRYSSELGIDVDAGDPEVERWFVASTLFGTRISARVAARTFGQLAAAGINRIVDAGSLDWNVLVALLDAGGYARYDFRTATRLQTLAREVADRYGGDVGEIGRRFLGPAALVAALDDLPGWGPVTIGLYLRELRGVWPGAGLPLDQRAIEGARHLGLLTGGEGDALASIVRIARRSGCDERDLESALVRLALDHRRVTTCPGSGECVALGHGRPPPR
ncbi:MAG TPA: hypothetical protein VMU75_03040 [Acidimicrobiales bacterium]|nr:hypothetical protein [Acidimicrobiales bacterium]